MDNQSNYNNGNNGYGGGGYGSGGPGNNGSNGNNNNNGNNGDNNNKNNKNGQMIMVFILVSLVSLFIMSMVMNRYTSMSTSEISYSDFLQMVEDGKVESVEFDSYQINITPVSENKNSYLQEQTYYCGRLDDPDLLPLLKDKGITISRVIPDNTSTWIYNILSFLLPLVLIWILMGVLMKRMGGGAMGVGKSTAKVYVEKTTGVTFKDVAGQDEAKESLQEVVDFLHNPKKYREIGAKLPKGALLVGPPGTGKTSIARSIAEALNKKYVRICLGGVTDESEIRGHRKTYVGAMPGRIATAIRQANTANPLILLDEIDKLGQSIHGDPAAAMLEVLDSEQNSKFRDNYLEVPLDLSKVMFIATANDLSNISRPLLDRMEIIEVGSYTANEKFHIAKEHLIKKQIKENGLLVSDVKFTDKVIRTVINSYTREAGVRGLERQIAKIVRKAVRELYKAGVFTSDGTRDKTIKKTVNISDKNITDYLGKVKYRPDKKNAKGEVGIVRGLAWTQAGGDTLEIEVITMPGKGEFKLTGNMGDVMKESASIAVSYIRSVTEKGRYKVDAEYFQNHAFHLHIPEGATPKDGPSAGITMATAVLSAVTGIPVRADVAMTGELTLRGKVLPIGGLKEKLLASKTAGITNVFVPRDNRSDVEELDTEITEGMNIIYVNNAIEVFAQALMR